MWGYTGTGPWATALKGWGHWRHAPLLLLPSEGEASVPHVFPILKILASCRKTPSAFPWFLAASGIWTVSSTAFLQQLFLQHLVWGEVGRGPLGSGCTERLGGWVHTPFSSPHHGRGHWLSRSALALGCAVYGEVIAGKVKVLFLPVSMWLFLVIVLPWGCWNILSVILIKTFWFIYHFYIVVSMRE